MRIVLTGATGFLGRNLAVALQRQGAQVVALGRDLHAGEALRSPGIEFRPADILDRDRLNQAISVADCLIHCAGRSGDWGDYSEFYDTNVVGTRNVIGACDHASIRRVILISTPSLYSTGKDRFNVRESDPLPNQTTHYGRTKLLAEQELLNSRNLGLQVIILRPRVVYGPYDRTFAPRLLRLAEKGRIPLVNGGRALIDITYIDNFVSAVSACLNADDCAWNEVYNVSNGDPVRVRDWYAQMLRVFDRPFRPVSVPGPVARTAALLFETAARLPFGPKQPAITRLSVSYSATSLTLALDKARRRLGWFPALSSTAGFEAYARWREKSGSSAKPG